MASGPSKDTNAAPRKVCLETFFIINIFYFLTYGFMVILPVFSDELLGASADEICTKSTPSSSAKA